MRELRHLHCIFTDDFTLYKLRQQGYCSFCREQGSDLAQCEVSEQYPQALVHIVLGKTKVRCRDGKMRGIYTTARAKAFPVKTTVKVDGVSISGFVYWSEVDKMYKFRANPLGTNYELLKEPPFGYEKMIERFMEPPVWSMHPHYKSKLEAAELPKLRSEVSEAEWLASAPGEIIDDTVYEPEEGEFMGGTYEPVDSEGNPIDYDETRAYSGSEAPDYNELEDAP